MTERRQFETLAEQAPVPHAWFTDEVLATARRRVRRNWALLGVCAAVVAVGVGVPTVAALSNASSTPAAGPRADSGPPSEVHKAHRHASATGQIYIAALGARPRPTPGAANRSMHVLTHTCTNIVEAGIGPCDPQPIPIDVQREVSEAMPGVQWVDKARLPKPSAHPGYVVVTLGPVERTGQRATVAIQAFCGFDCGAGKTLVLKLSHGAWQVTGTTGDSWIT